MRLLGGEGVEVAANRVRGAGDLLGAAVLRALEEHVLDKMRDAVFLGPLLTRARAQPDADGNGTDRRHRLGEDREPVGKNVFVNVRHPSKS